MGRALAQGCGRDWSERAVAHVLFWVAVAMIAGFILLGSLAERLSRVGGQCAGDVGHRHEPVHGRSADGGFRVGSQWVLPMWVLFGFFRHVGHHRLCRPSPSDSRCSCPGRVTTSVNLLVFVAAFIGQWAIGAIIGHWPVGAGGQLRPGRLPDRVLCHAGPSGDGV